MRARLITAALAVALLLSACGSSAQQNSSRASAQSFGPATRLPDLEHPGHSRNLFALFNGDQAVPRLVLLVSPT